jgi:hypothetical protein
MHARQYSDFFLLVAVLMSYYEYIYDDIYLFDTGK